MIFVPLAVAGHRNPGWPIGIARVLAEWRKVNMLGFYPVLPSIQVTIVNNSAVETKLEAVIREVFDGEQFDFLPDLSRVDVKAWDSLGHIRLISAIEEAFGVSFSLEEIESLTSVDRFLALLADKR